MGCCFLYTTTMNRYLFGDGWMNGQHPIERILFDKYNIAWKGIGGTSPFDAGMTLVTTSASGTWKEWPTNECVTSIDWSDPLFRTTCFKHVNRRVSYSICFYSNRLECNSMDAIILSDSGADAAYNEANTARQCAGGDYPPAVAVTRSHTLQDGTSTVVLIHWSSQTNTSFQRF